MQASDMAHEEYSSRVRHAQRITLDIGSILDPMLYALISHQADAVGCSKELLLFPLLSSIAALTGPETFVQITPDWKERLVLWYLVAGRKGERKTPALNRIKYAILDILSVDTSIENSNKISFVDEFCARDITKTTEDNVAVLGCFDDFHDVLQVLETCPKESTAYFPARKYMSMLHDRAVHNHERTHNRRFVNVTGTIDSLSAAHLMNEGDQYGLLERLLVCFAPEKSRYGVDTVKQESKFTNISAVFADVHRRHQTKLIYTFTKEGQEEFCRCYENFIQWNSSKHSDDRRRSLVAKAPGHLARLCATLLALRNGMFGAASSAAASTTPLSTTISEDIVKSAYAIVEYLLRQQISMLPAETLFSISDEEDIPDTIPPSVSPMTSLMSEHKPPQTMSIMPKSILQQKYNNTEQLIRHADVISFPSNNEFLATPVVRSSLDQHNNHSIDLTSDETSNVIHSILQNESQDIENTNSMPFHLSRVDPQYFTRRPPPVNYTSLSEMSDEEFVKVTAWKLRKLLSCRGLEIPSAWAAQKRLFPPVPKELRTGKSSHPVWAAIAFFERVSQVGFGDVVAHSSTAKTAPTYSFKKKRLEELSEKACAILKKIHLSEEEYANSYPKAPSTVKV